MLFLITISSIFHLGTARCHACFDNKCYSKTTLPIPEPQYFLSGQLAIDRTDNILHFHYKDKNSTDYTATFDLDNIRFTKIPGIDFSFARTIDQSNRIVYLSGAKGVFKYNPISNSIEQFGLIDTTVWQMQFKNKLYYTAFLRQGLYTFDRKPKVISALSNFTIDDFIIDFREDLYFLSGGKVYRLKKGSIQVELFANDEYLLSVDKDELPHFMHRWKKGLYELDINNDSLAEVGGYRFGVPFKFVFDNNNNVIYYDNITNKLYYLMPNYSKCKISSKSETVKHKGLKKLGKQVNDPNGDFTIIVLD